MCMCIMMDLVPKYILPLIAKTCSCLESITDKPESQKYNKFLKILYLNETN